MSDSDNMLPSSGPLATDDDILQFTQGKRKQLIDQITEKGMPEDNKDRVVLLAAMADMDRTALSNKKIGVKERDGAANRQTALMIAAITERFGAQGPFRRQDTPGSIPTFDDAGLPALELVEGETTIGVANRTYDDFVAEVESKLDDKQQKA